MDTHRLRVLVELHRRGTMRAVADATGYGTSTVSMHLATLEREVGAILLERTGRTVRFTPAGRRLVEHAEGILAAIDAAHAALGPDGPPSGVLRVAAYTSALTSFVLPVVRPLAASHPDLRVELQEREPPEVAALLADDEIDLGFVYDYNLVPRFADDETARYVCSTPMVLVVPAGPVPTRLEDLAGEPWVANSRSEDDTELAERCCALAGFAPRVTHRADSLELVMDIVAAGLGVALVPDFLTPRAGVVLTPIPGVEAVRRMYAVTRPGRQAWPAAALLTRLVTEYSRANP
ncbi:LysR family transcriptional regulator [Longispora urticae]